MPGENRTQGSKHIAIRWLVGFVIIVGGFGVLLIILSAEFGESLATKVFEELGIAFVVAAILAAGVDTFAHMKFAEELRELTLVEVLATVFRRLIPDRVFDQVRDHILTADKVRRNYRVTMKLTRELAGRKDDFECETLYTYEIHNITGYSPRSSLVHNLDHDLKGYDSTGKELPRFVSATIDSDPVDLSKCVKDKYRLQHEIQLPKGKKPLFVEIHVASIRRVPDTWNWNMSELAEGATIEIDAVAPEAAGVKFEVRALHPEREELEPQAGNGAGGKWMWKFKPALLTWQGFEFTSSR
jgi:hypothetical protein